MLRKIISLVFISVFLFSVMVCSPVMVEQSSVHDVAVISVTRSVPLERLYPLPATILYVHADTWSLYVNVTVKNVGDFTENFTVKAYYGNATGNWTIGTKNVTDLAPGASIRVDFKWSPTSQLVHWNSTTHEYLGYTVSAEATLSDDANLGDNVLVNGEVRPVFLGDVNQDGVISGGDAAVIGGSWYKKVGEPGYIPMADVNFDGKVDEGDLAAIGMLSDVAVTEVTRSIPKERLAPRPNELLYAYPGWTVYINVTVKNVGNRTESFTVKAYCENTVIGTQSVTSLAPGASIRLDFKWIPTSAWVKFNWTARKYKTYPVKGEAVIEDMNPGNNVLVDGKVAVAMTGDVNKDGIVNAGDGPPVGICWYKKVGDPGYDPNADQNFDGIVSGGDAALIGAFWYKKAPDP